MDHEQALIKAFIVPQKRERYLGFVTNPKRRPKFISELAHFKSIDSRYVVGIPPGKQTASEVMKLLVARGASHMAWVISEDSRLDAREMDLATALEATIGHGMGTFVSCLPGKLAFFEDEERRCLLVR